MHHQKLILFDFDGVIVNGIDEYWFSSKLACEKYLKTSCKYLNIDKYIQVPKIFIEIRPWVKYGWEMILITHEILKIHKPLNDVTKNSFLENYEEIAYSYFQNIHGSLLNYNNTLIRPERIK